MRIFFTNTAPIIVQGIGAAFADLGHPVCYVNVAVDPDWKKKLREFAPDLVFTEGGWGTFDKLFPFLREHRLRHLFWAIEDPPHFHNLSLPFATRSTWVFTTCQESIPAYRQHGIDARLMLFACHPANHRSVPADPRYHYDIAFVGNNYFQYQDRNRAAHYLLQPLMDRGYNLKIFGLDWWLDRSRPYSIAEEFYGGYLPAEQLPTMCNSVPIILGLHSVTDSRTMMSMRTFEILGSGGFFLTQWTPAIENLFRNHHHLVWTRSEEETLDLVNYYLKNPAARQRIARQGQEEVYRHHTYIHRIQAILSLLEEKLQLPSDKRVPAAAPPFSVRYGKSVRIARE